MNYLSDLAEKFGTQLIKPRQYNYSQQLLEHFFLDNPQLSYKFDKIPNKRSELLEILLVCSNYSSTTVSGSASKTCIIYAHGLGSNKLQVLPILKYYKNLPYDVCSFDFSGSGKSEGQFTSYGLREQDDINSVLTWLDSTKNYDSYVLWGRSMGSVAIILSQGLVLNPKVKGIVLDSPFSSFEKICLEIASQKSYIPELFLGPLVSCLKQHFFQSFQKQNSNGTHFGINPFSMNIMERVSRIKRKIMFVYSKKDTVVNCYHSIALKLNCSQSASEIQIVEDHNMQRSKETLHQIRKFIECQLGDTGASKSNTLRHKPFQNKSVVLESASHRQKSTSNNRQRGLSLISRGPLAQNSNKQLKSKAENVNGNQKKTSNNSAKLHLSICQTAPSAKRNTRNSFMTTISIAQTLPSAESKQLPSEVCKNQRKTLKHPLSLASLNSGGENQNFLNLRKDSFEWQEKLNMTQKMQPQFESSHQQKGKRLDSFYSAQFMNENLNSLCSINSICLNKKKFKNREPESKKDKQNVRPSIQLRRRNRFLV